MCNNVNNRFNSAVTLILLILKELSEVPLDQLRQSQLTIALRVTLVNTLIVVMTIDSNNLNNLKILITRINPNDPDIL